MADKAVRRRVIAWVGLAAVAGLFAGIGAVYVSGEVAGNGDGVDCAPAVAAAEALRPLARGEVAAFLPAERPMSLAALTVMGADGVPVSLAALADKPLFVNLWATWCAPCRAEMPAISRMADALGDKAGVVAINLDTGDYAKAQAFLDEIGVDNLGAWRDPRMKIFNDLKAEGLAFGLPTTLVVAPGGCQLGVMHGPAEWDSPEAIALMEAATGGS
ncbi:thiol:disulfide interchange protein TlpA [Methylobrevis pamukkalensis]|uniref:Thiol:disulfide interchange protein TlpA n=1 Tax=Methylobrevis pamukkalensis TaxID=1439726 RepID=A0A1E3H7U9_9HYPH|nr:TlpA disulfide reductase family protein [Methylobrevis pamukkalensis]ODN72390.1 Thiol:disulfide interchange protein TlpA [Methylobrevis pamukkalensis]